MLAFILLYCLLSTIANCTEPVDDPCGFFACWTTDNYVNTHVAVDDYYRNKTLCVITESDGTNRKINFTAPVNFEISGS
jgi:hypothetical protein